MRELSGSARCGAAVKADAYGTGAVAGRIPGWRAKAAATSFVADANEGRDACARIFRTPASMCSTALFEGSFAQTPGPRPRSGGQLAANRPHSGTGNADGRPYALHVDTGMNRLGLTPEQAVQASRRAARPPLPC
jgi:alanine racemase